MFEQEKMFEQLDFIEDQANGQPSQQKKSEDTEDKWVGVDFLYVVLVKRYRTHHFPALREISYKFLIKVSKQMQQFGLEFIRLITLDIF